MKGELFIYSCLSFLTIMFLSGAGCGVTERQAKKEFEDNVAYFQQLAADAENLRQVLGQDFGLHADSENGTFSFWKKDTVIAIYRATNDDTWKKGLPGVAILLINRIHKDWTKAGYERLNILSDDSIAVDFGETRISSQGISFQYSFDGTPGGFAQREPLEHGWLLVIEQLEWAIS